MRVFVLMGNDYPGGVFANEVEADEACKELTVKDNVPGRRIYWRLYPFELQGKFEETAAMEE